MFVKTIENGDLILKRSHWWLAGKFVPYRNLSEEARVLEDLQDAALAKFKELKEQHTVASANVYCEMSLLQRLLSENSSATWYSESEQSLLERREGVDYGRKEREKIKREAAEKQKAEQAKKQKEKEAANAARSQNNTQSPKGKNLSLLEILSKANVTLQ